MRTLMLMFFLLTMLLAPAQPVFCEPKLVSMVTMHSYSNSQLQSRYLREARAYRSEGRYELARQSYALALSLATKQSQIERIRQELDSVEMLLRSMR